jgi:hypothetical protein
MFICCCSPRYLSLTFDRQALGILQFSRCGCSRWRRTMAWRRRTRMCRRRRRRRGMNHELNGGLRYNVASFRWTSVVMTHAPCGDNLASYEEIGNVSVSVTSVRYRRIACWLMLLGPQQHRDYAGGGVGPLRSGGPVRLHWLSVSRKMRW